MSVPSEAEIKCLCSFPRNPPSRVFLGPYGQIKQGVISSKKVSGLTETIIFSCAFLRYFSGLASVDMLWWLVDVLSATGDQGQGGGT